MLPFALRWGNMSLEAGARPITSQKETTQREGWPRMSPLPHTHFINPVALGFSDKTDLAGEDIWPEDTSSPSEYTPPPVRKQPFMLSGTWMTPNAIRSHDKHNLFEWEKERRQSSQRQGENWMGANCHCWQRYVPFQWLRHTCWLWQETFKRQRYLSLYSLCPYIP